MIWLSLIIPFATALFIYNYFGHVVIWWEALIPVGVAIIIIGATSAIDKHGQTHDIEYWTGYLTKVEYYESWTEQYTTVETYSDGKNIKTRVVTKIRHHPPYWQGVDNMGLTYSISRKEFDYYCAWWGSNYKVDIFHFGQISWGDGNKYVGDWPRDWNRAQVCTFTRSYKNKILPNYNLFQYVHVDKKEIEQYQLYDYPYVANYFNVPSVLGWSGPEVERLNKLNAYIGATKEVRMWVLVFRNQPVLAAQMQEALWVRGNKNELVVCVGLNGNKVDWCHTFSWCDREKVGPMMENIQTNSINKTLDEVITITYDNVTKHWVRKNFEDFDYISIPQRPWAIAIAYILVIMSSAGCSAFAILNEIHPE